MTQKTYSQYCPLAHALDLIGERWTLLIIRNLVVGPKRFTDLLRGLPGIGTNILTTRLKALEASGLIQSHVLPPPAASAVYELTPYGRSLEDIMAVLSIWGAKSLGPREPGQNYSIDSISFMLYMTFKAAVPWNLSEVFEIQIEEAEFHAKFWIKVQGETISVTQEPAASQNLILRASLATLGSLGTGFSSYKEAVAQGSLQIEGSEAEIANFLACMEPQEEKNAPTS